MPSQATYHILPTFLLSRQAITSSMCGVYDAQTTSVCRLDAAGRPGAPPPTWATLVSARPLSSPAVAPAQPCADGTTGTELLC